MVNSWDEKWSQFLRNTEPKHKYAAFILLTAYLFINNSINAASKWTEFTRSDSNNVALWEPYVWEYSSALSTSLLVIPLIIAIRKLEQKEKLGVSWLGWHFAFASLFSVAHVSLMVAFRKLAYLFSERNYDFGIWFNEFIYEYRKDVWGYITLVTFYYIARFGYQRLIGEASLITSDTVQDSNDNAVDSLPDYLLVKKLNKEFLVQVTDIQRVEASGNYINLHTHLGVYPLRYTLSRFCEEGAHQGFMRVHRSHAVRIPAIVSISYEETGDGSILLNNGQTVTLSRRYKDSLKQVLAPN
ncbi:LytR/AlgR family response regulator transcription factor [Alteromonas sp. ALT199]|uniref:LytR/AlgR family response regulator transcription factor n=1 Tax=unclassified Alteromonas TaxID=2614992 RepID=UPI0028834FDB|nr:LytTR family DNA-binding domain-containing protein [Alteromonas sp. ALT199]